ncbi:MAG: hypothetical protein KDA41_14500 [Planctomycetales bacterium]|nr:hypothetical protein [Planctomycetales bacterium]
MPKIWCIVGMVIASLIFLLFVLDLALAFPFSRAAMLMDILFVISAALLGWLSWSTFQEQP